MKNSPILRYLCLFGLAVATACDPSVELGSLAAIKSPDLSCVLPAGIKLSKISYCEDPDRNCPPNTRMLHSWVSKNAYGNDLQDAGYSGEGTAYCFGDFLQPRPRRNIICSPLVWTSICEYTCQTYDLFDLSGPKCKGQTQNDCPNPCAHWNDPCITVSCVPPGIIY